MSELLQIFIDVIVPIFLIVGAAFWVGRRLNPDIRSLSTVLIYLFIPALSFRTMIRLPIDGVQDVVTGSSAAPLRRSRCWWRSCGSSRQ
ncbi:MAG: hypothetical protein HND48_25420 [Chloroflexi bacterium]|nr:hypothetical protein [Chloroflexota bacterium]